MAIGNGIGYQGGNETVLNGFFNGITNAYNRNQASLAKQAENAAKAQAENEKQLAAIVKKVNVNGVQKQDLPELTERLDDIYDTYYKANKATTNAERIENRMDLERKITEIGSFVNLSKERGQRFVKIADQMATKPQLFSAESRQAYLKNLDTPTSKLTTDDLNLNRYISPDTSVLDKTEDALIKNLWSRANETLSYGKTTGVGATGDLVTRTTKTKSIRPEDIGTELMRSYNTDAGYKNLIDYQAEQVGMTPQDYLVARTNELVKINKPQTTQGSFRNSRPRKSGGDDDESTPGFVVEQNYQQNYGSRSTTVNEKGDNAPVVATLTAREYVGIPTAPTVTAGKFDMVDSNGNKYDARNTTEELKLVGLGTYPVLARDTKETNRNGSRTLKAGSLVTESFAKANPRGIRYEKKAIVSRKTKDEEGNDIVQTFFAKPNEVVPRTKLTKAGKAALNAYEKTHQQNSGGKVR